MPRRPFTVDEANALLPLLERVVDRIHRGRRALEGRRDKLFVLDALWGSRVKEPGNPDHEEYKAHLDRLKRTAQRLERIVRDEIVERGIRFPPGGLEHGLLDFPTTWQGRWVFLCWQAGEDRIRAWHELSKGFAGRQPLTDEQARRMGREDGAAEVDDPALDL